MEADKPDKQYLPVGRLTATLTPVKIVEKPAEGENPLQGKRESLPNLLDFYHLAKI